MNGLQLIDQTHGMPELITDVIQTQPSIIIMSGFMRLIIFVINVFVFLMRSLLLKYYCLKPSFFWRVVSEPISPDLSTTSAQCLAGSSFVHEFGKS